MKIAFDITVLYIASAGVFYYRYNLLKAMLARSSHEFVLVDYAPLEGEWGRRDPPKVRALLETGVETLRVRGLKHRKLVHLSWVQRLNLVKAAGLIDWVADPVWRKLVKSRMDPQFHKHLADVQVFHSSDVLNYALPKAKNVTTIYDLTALLFPEYHTELVRKTMAQKFHFAQTQADAVIAISESTKRDVVKHLGLDPALVHVAYCGVADEYKPLPVDLVAECLHPLGLVPQTYILHLGTIEPRKNLTRLLQAYHQLRRSRWHSLAPMPKLVHVGMKGWMYEEVLAQVHALDLEDDVVFMGRVASDLLPALYNGARVFAYPSLYEGFGLPVLEAMACGTPVVTSNTSSLPEVAGDAALMVDPYDVAQIAEAMERLLVDQDLAYALRQRGLAQAARFTWQACAAKTCQVYEHIERVG
jgi:glycosyltransferase involved in cell wall biosynthesis